MIRTTTIVLCLLCYVVTGCVAYRHKRVKKAEQTKESTTMVSLFKKGEADMVQSTTSDGTNGYSRTVGIKQVKSSGDADTAKATAEGFVEGMK